MIYFMMFLTVASVAIILPVWLKVNKIKPQSSLLLAVTPFALTLWIILAAQGIGGQTFFHGLEMLGIAIITLVASFMKLLVWDKNPNWAEKSLSWVVLIAVVSVFAFRLLLA